MEKKILFKVTEDRADIHFENASPGEVLAAVTAGVVALCKDFEVPISLFCIGLKAYVAADEMVNKKEGE